MSSTATFTSPVAVSAPLDWSDLSGRVLGGHRLTVDEGLAILNSSDEELLELLAAAYRVRRRYFGKTVQLYFLMNAKSGLCPEDCSYCSQSKVSTAEIPRYNILNRAKLLDGARLARERRRSITCAVAGCRSSATSQSPARTPSCPAAFPSCLS